jgi:hypothetical protein
MGFIYILDPQLVTTCKTAVSLFYRLYKSLGHAKSSHPSVVASKQRIYNSLTVTTSHYEVAFVHPNSFCAISSQLFCQLQRPSQFSAATAKSGIRLP